MCMCACVCIPYVYVCLLGALVSVPVYDACAVVVVELEPGSRSSNEQPSVNRAVRIRQRTTWSIHRRLRKHVTWYVSYMHYKKYTDLSTIIEYLMCLKARAICFPHVSPDRNPDGATMQSNMVVPC